MSLKEYGAKPAAERAATVSDFIDKMTTDLRAKNPELATAIRNWFVTRLRRQVAMRCCCARAPAYGHLFLRFILPHRD